MHPLDWVIVVAYLSYVLVDGVRRAKGTHELDGYFLAHRSLPWWAVGLSVMATQLSAITLIGTTGQGASDGMRFVQFYFGLPVAMVILGVTLVPFLHRAKVFTAYEILERRFDAKTRSLTSLLFLVLRGMSCGTIIAAPAVIFSTIFGWNLFWSVAAMGVPTVLYTMVGGVQAVAWVDVKQMALIVAALVAVVITLLVQLPVSPTDALHLAGASGRLHVFDFSPTLHETYTFWSGLLGGTFLMLSYFGTDQSQVQRYITTRSVSEAKSSLLMSAYWKIPLQALVLLVGVLVFVFYVFRAPPLYFDPVEAHAVEASDAATYRGLETRYATALDERAAAARAVVAARDAGDATAAVRGLEVFKRHNAEVAAVHREAIGAAERVRGRESEDVNFIMPWFVLHSLPIGLVGVFIAAVFAAAMSSVAAELNSLASVTAIDLYRRWVRPEASDAHFLRVSKLATAFWGVFACVVATFAATLGSLIEVVNRFGSFFYGSLLGVFLLAMIPRARALGAFVGLIAGMCAVAAMAFGAPAVSYLWQNVVGAVTVVAVGMVLSLGHGPVKRAA
jgi:SSS family solute:Na+ symporter